MPDALEVPYSLAGFCVQRNQAVSEQIVADAIRAIKIKRSRSGRDEDDAALFIDSHPSPIIRRAAGFSSAGWPGVMTEFAVIRNCAKRPTEFAGAHIVGAHITGRSPQGFGIAPSHDDRAGLQTARLAGIEHPCHAQLLHVASVDLR